MEPLARTLALSLLSVSILGIGCSDEPGGTAGSGASSGTSSGGSGPGECAQATDCPGDAVCDPATGQCTSGLSCAAHTDCGSGAFCDAGTCRDSMPGGPCDDTPNCVSGETCTGGVCGCGGALYGADNVPPNVLIVLDRSGSMNEQITGGTKWDIGRQAINGLVTTYGGGVFFGLAMYPGTDLEGTQGMMCGPGAVFVDPAAGTAAAISSDLAAAGTTSFGTPTAEMLTALTTYAGLKDPMRADYILLITDGQSTCEDPVPVVASLLGATPSVKTFVVGFGSGVDPAELDDMAQAGGTAGPMSPFYYQADDATSLASAFAAIAGSVLSCSYVLSDTPPDPSLLYVYIDGMQVPADNTNGWVYDAATNQLTFVGTTCDALKSGTAGELVISYGCPIGTPQ